MPGPRRRRCPRTIAVVGDFKPFLVGHAIGWQVHTCAATATGYAWSFDGPTATLYDDHGKLLATHSAGPTWTRATAARSSATVVDRAFVSPTAIPWLLLRTTPSPGGPDGDRLSAHHPHPADRDHRRPDAGAADCTADQRRRDAARALHGGLRVLEGHRRS